MDLFDPKPKLNELNGQALPESMTKNVRFAFIRKETAKLMGSPRKFANGTKMTFAGLSNPQDRANVIAYLREQAATKQPLPAAQ